MFYPDNDRVTLMATGSFEPEFKRDFDPELLETTNYIGRFFLVKRDFFEKYGSVDADFSGACDYDLLLRLTEAAKRNKVNSSTFRGFSAISGWRKGFLRGRKSGRGQDLL